MRIAAGGRKEDCAVMNAKELTRFLLPLREHEQQMRECFLRYPAAYRQMNHGWEDFRQLCCREYGGAISFPEKEVGFMGPELSEQDCFADEHREINVILHDRFFPPYCQRVGFLKILYCLCGQAEFYTGQTAAVLSAGDFVMVPPGEEHAVCAAGENALTLNLIIKKSTFGSAFASLLAGQNLISDFFWQMLCCKGGMDALLFRCENDGRLSDLIVRLWEENNESGCSNDVLIKGLVILFFGTVIKYHADNVEQLKTCREGGRRLSEMIRYMVANYQTVTLSAMAEHFHRSEGYISRYIHSETGKTFRLLLREFRLEKAAEMLRSSACTVEEVVGAVGYTEPSRFYRNFKERFGTTPAAYRQRSGLAGFY